MIAPLAVALGAAAMDGEVASRFATAPDAAPDQDQLVQIEVNGVDQGNAMIRMVKGSITLPPGTVSALGIVSRPGQGMELTPGGAITFGFDAPESHLALTVPISMLSSKRFAPDSNEPPVSLSPETWGVYMNYDLNLRHSFGQGETETTTVTTGTASVTTTKPVSPIVSGGGTIDLRVLAPDVIGSFGEAYDSATAGPGALVRLDSTLTWRPTWLDLALSVGDAVSVTSDTTASGRAYRYGGLQIGTDFSGTPGYSNSAIPSVMGTAQAQSAIDVYLDGQRSFHTTTSGGDFSLVLPPGATNGGTNVVITDVTGRMVVIPVEVARTDAQLLRKGAFLWSAGIGAPRFGYGSSATRYAGKLFGYGNARYGLSDRLTATLHGEGAAGLAEIEGGADIAVRPWLALHGGVAASRSSVGAGGMARLGIVMALPGNIGLEANAARAFGSFDDAVSVSGRDFAERSGFALATSAPARSVISGRISWQPVGRTSLSASYQASSFPGSPPVGLAALTVNYLAAGRLPVFVSLSHTMGRDGSSAVLAGVSISLWGTQFSASSGYGEGNDGSAALGKSGGYTGGITASRSLGETPGDYGWNAYATHSPSGLFSNADAAIRTGYGIAGAAVQSFGSQVTTYGDLRGSAGLVGLHPFVSDPASGGIIIADAGQPGIPVQINGYDKGHTAFDGKMALAGAVSGVPQRVAIDMASLPIDSVPAATDQLVTVRNGGAALASFGVHSFTASALIVVTVAGGPPPLGSILSSATSSAPVSKEGRAYLTSLAPEEALTLEMPDGRTCPVQSHFDGHGGVGRRIGPLACGSAQ